MASTRLYAPLQHQDCIRLLQLKPGNEEHGIDMTLKPFRLISATKFTALSYVWGIPTPKRLVFCNGHRVSVTPSLYGALSRLLRQGFDGLLWVDALCINQQDNEEKSAQVAMMTDIFSQATKVIFWLGEQQQFDEEGARLMRTFFQRHPAPLATQNLRYQTLLELGLPYFDNGWYGWASLITRPWFGRIWIVQEFSNARKSIFMSGAVEIPTEALLHCAAASSCCADIRNIVEFQTEGSSFATTLLQRSTSLYIAQVNANIVGKEDIGIDYIWKRSRLLEATDARDRVFALLSLQNTLPMGMIDYSKSIVEVYTEAAEIALTSLIPSEPSSQLSHNSSGNETQRSSRFLACKVSSLGDSELPSWVPDWRPSRIMFTPLTDYFPGISSFEHPYQDAVIEKRTMSISGTIADRPWVVINYMPYAEDIMSMYHRESPHRTMQVLEESYKYRLNWQYMCYLSAQSKNPAVSRDRLLAAFCRTMAFAALSNQNAATDAEYVGGFQALRKQISSAYRQGDRHGYVFEGPETSDRRCDEYEDRFTELSAGRKFCVTQAGRLAWVPLVAEPGDEICFLAGCAVPFVIRRAGDFWELLGDCYLDGLMSYRSPVFRPRPQLFKFI